jgi:hypothetical protein
MGASVGNPVSRRRRLARRGFVYRSGDGDVRGLAPDVRTNDEQNAAVSITNA